MVATSFPWESLATGCQLDMPGCGGRESKPASSAVRLTAILSARFADTLEECNPDASNDRASYRCSISPASDSARATIARWSFAAAAVDSPRCTFSSTCFPLAKSEERQ